MRVQQHMQYARFVARKYWAVGIPHDDLYQIAYEALMHAVRRYEPSAGSSLETYARPVIEGAILHYVRDRQFIVRAPRRWFELNGRILRVVDELQQEFGHTATAADLAQRLQMDAGLVRQAQLAYSSISGISYDLEDDDGEAKYSVRQPFHDCLHDPVADIDGVVALRDLMGRLPRREAQALALYAEGFTQRECAQRIGVTQKHISRLIAQGRERLTQMMAVV